MIRIAALAAFILAFESAPVLGCGKSSPKADHEQEIVLLDNGIKTSKRAPAEIAKAKELRDLAEASYKAGNYSQAETERHSALVQIGYTPPPPTRGCGEWTAPVE
jgi:hypothetical protein